MCWCCPRTRTPRTRAAQEGFTNALRHGRATHLTLRVQARPDEVTLDVIDDGQGLPNGATVADTPAGHYGLRWLAERAESLGGKLRVQASQPRGVHLHLSLPLHGATTTEPRPTE